MSEANFSITPEGFVQEFKDLKNYLVSNYFSGDSKISRIDKLQNAGLSEEQIEITKRIVNEALTDALYTVLLGLDGCASIGRHQINYKLFDEKSNELTGELESIAWEKLHGENT
ncbi:hypothetical protein [Undibacterium flavidum]|uniref:Uncharacterized protein n=1 Tax=Undibacterium flavidum TaxID=2762297 RepID=A0ABR6Y8K0_9BURK|nr:hypothetical protein [Undibacterium flavidum]MBC3872916.1 hypothetical protein [Undibacterium flavidum]